MDSLLYKIYSGDYDTTIKPDKALREVDKKLWAERDKVCRMFGDAFTDRLLELEDEREDRRGFCLYREGFRLGVRLMLEALTPASATE